jgi:hypothetical protein
MARPIRIEFAEALYHVMGRGDGGESLFRDDLDRRLFLERPAEACKRTGWRGHACVLRGSQRLGMSHDSRVTQAVSQMRPKPGRNLAKLGWELEGALSREGKADAQH